MAVFGETAVYGDGATVLEAVKEGLGTKAESFATADTGRTSDGESTSTDLRVN